MKNKQLLFKNSLLQYKSLQGFSLVELSLTIAIVAGLATAAVVTMNPVEMLAQMRDGQRIAAVGTLREILGVLISENPNLPTGFGLTNFAYISLPDTHSDCRNIIINLPPRTDGRAYHCVTAANLMRIDGAGWMPVNLTAIRGGSPISVLPVDPINNTSFFYEYLPSAHHRYAFSARIESIRQRALSPVFTKRFAAPFNFSLLVGPSSGAVIRGGSISTTVTASLISGTTRAVSFSTSGLPAGVTTAFSPTSCNPLCNSTLNIVTSAVTPIGAHSITITGASIGITRTTTYSLIVN